MARLQTVKKYQHFSYYHNNLKKLSQSFLLGSVALLLGNSAFGQSVTQSRTTAAGVSVLVLTVDMNDPNVRVTGIMAERGTGSTESFGSMIQRSRPIAAFTGTFFSTSSFIPVGDMVINGVFAHHGGVGTGLCITEDNQIEFVKPPYCYAPMDWGLYDFVCCAGPRLVTEGVAYVSPRKEGFRDPSLLGRASRLAVGVTPTNKLLFVATRNSIHLSKLAQVMKKLGCSNAINLDAGSSLGFYFDGKTFIQPGRRLTNAILIYANRKQYNHYKDQLLP